MNSEDLMMNNEVEVHPFPPYIPDNAKVLIMGTFPPQPKRWSMEFYYPNRTNDFWPIMGLIFLGNKDALKAPGGKSFNLEAIQALLTEHGIAISDTGFKVRRLKNNASDKFLEIIEPAPLNDLLSRMPQCRGIATTGEKAAEVVADITNTIPPKIGHYVWDPVRDIQLWRMPSTSRAYPLALEKKADFYRQMFQSLNIIQVSHV